MIPHRFVAVLLLLAAFTSLKGVETVVNGNATYNTNSNISGSVSGWSSGWGSGNTNTGWDYVGQVSDASGVYLGNGWVLTAAHVNSPTTFTLNGNVYNNTGTYYSNFTNSLTGTTKADLTLFKISTISTSGTNLPLNYNLTITPSDPAVFSTVVMIGLGGTNGVGLKSWGANFVAGINIYPINVNDRASVDFVSPNSGTNYGEIVLGDSGGGVFINVGDAAHPQWELAGINEAILQGGTNYYSGFVQLSSYQTQISAIVTSVPESGTWALLGIGLLFVALPLWRGRLKG